ncbi:MAG: hypothetical protein IJT70_07330 [Clostridia bacterium]|nr:hypothetical protein [Clostridia bacterium]
MKKIIMRIFGAFLLILLVFLIVRIFIAESEGTLSDAMPTAALKEAYYGGEDILTHGIEEPNSTDGVMRCYSLIWIPSAGEMQVTVKYNYGIYRNNNLTEGSPFAFKLYDSASEKEYDDYSEKRDESGHYGYYRLAFHGVSYSPGSDIEIVMCSPDYNFDYSVVKLHASGQEFVKYELSDEEIAALGE